jgi:hypothetical protein
MSEVKQAAERAGASIERPPDTLSVEEGVFNKAQNRSLTGQAVVDVCLRQADGNRLRGEVLSIGRRERAKLRISGADHHNMQR